MVYCGDILPQVRYVAFGQNKQLFFSKAVISTFGLNEDVPMPFKVLCSPERKLLYIKLTNEVDRDTLHIRWVIRNDLLVDHKRLVATSSRVIDHLKEYYPGDKVFLIKPIQKDLFVLIPMSGDIEDPTYTQVSSTLNQVICKRIFHPTVKVAYTHRKGSGDGSYHSMDKLVFNTEVYRILNETMFVKYLSIEIQSTQILFKFSDKSSTYGDARCLSFHHVKTSQYKRMAINSKEYTEMVYGAIGTTETKSLQYKGNGIFKLKKSKSCR